MRICFVRLYEYQYITNSIRELVEYPESNLMQLLR